MTALAWLSPGGSIADAAEYTDPSGNIWGAKTVESVEAVTLDERPPPLDDARDEDGRDRVSECLGTLDLRSNPSAQVLRSAAGMGVGVWTNEAGWRFMEYRELSNSGVWNRCGRRGFVRSR